MLRVLSLLILIAIWQIIATIANSILLPEPAAVLGTMVSEARSGALFFNLGMTLARAIVSFGIAMLFGTLFGIAMGRNRTLDKLADPWLVVLLNLPALVIIVLAYIWIGLTETAAIIAVALNKLPNTTVTIREGARALDPGL